VYAHGSARVITASASSAQAMGDSDSCEKRVSQEHNQAKALEPTVASVTVRRVGLTVHLDVVAPRYVHLLVVGSRVDEVCPVPGLSATDSTTTALSSQVELDVSLRAAEMVEYLPPLPIVMAPDGGELSACAEIADRASRARRNSMVDWLLGRRPHSRCVVLIL
jgi:hypothetical protein